MQNTVMQENSENKEKSQKVYAIRLALDLVRRQHFHNDKPLDTSQQAINSLFQAFR